VGNEALCSVRVDGVGAEAKALLETEEVIVRGAVKARVRFRTLNTSHRRRHTGVADRASDDRDRRWRAGSRAVGGKDPQPQESPRQVGVKADWSSRSWGDRRRRLRKGTRRSGRQAIEGPGPGGSDIIFYGATKTRDLNGLARLKSSLHPAGAIWVVRPKGCGHITEAQVMQAAKAAGLVDTKVVKFSETLTARKL